MTKVAEVTGIPDSTLSHWKQHSDWWDTLLGDLRNEISDRILPQNLQIAERANERVLDSLENGDEKLVWDKEKKKHVIKRVKPGAYQSMLVSGISQDKARVQMNLPTSITANGNVEEEIKKIAQMFCDISAKYKEKQANAIPGEYKKIEEDQD